MQERAQRGVILARRFELRRGDNRVQFAREEDKAEQENERRQKNDGKDDPASQDFCPSCALCKRETNGSMCRTQSRGSGRSA